MHKELSKCAVVCSGYSQLASEITNEFILLNIDRGLVSDAFEVAYEPAAGFAKISTEQYFAQLGLGFATEHNHHPCETT